MIRIQNISLPINADEKELKKAAAERLHCSTANISRLTVEKRSIDARKKNSIRMIYTVNVEASHVLPAPLKAEGIGIYTPEPYRLPTCDAVPEKRPVVVGFGPAGMFAALILCEAGLKPIVLERGMDAERRREAVNTFWETGKLNTCSNVQFGEGGAGMFSDGKLNTGIHDGRIRYVLEQLVRFGADPDILCDAKPHVGTDVLYEVIQRLRRYLISCGAEIRFETKLNGLLLKDNVLCGITAEQNGTAETIPAEQMILAVGHSARDTFAMLLENGVPMEPKPFSMGVRIEHLQKTINASQYGSGYDPRYLPPADYKLSCKLPDGNSAYTFCMCPGGYVVAAASETASVVTNGMSNRARDGKNANSALLVTLHPEDFPYPGTLGGVKWQQELEHKAFLMGGENYCAPAQTVGDFLTGKSGTAAETVRPTYRPGVKYCDLHELFPVKISGTLEQAIPVFGKKIVGFDDPNAVITAPETRSSSPVRILRDGSFQSAVSGIYPCGEGAGYAGGIMSAACDGVRCAEALIKTVSGKA